MKETELERITDIDVEKEVVNALERVGSQAICDIEKECGKYVAASVSVIGRMMPKALEVVYEILDGSHKNKAGDGVRLQAAKYILGVFGVTERRKVEHEHTDKDLPNKKLLIEEFKNELRKADEHRRLSGGDQETSETAILLEPL